MNKHTLIFNRKRLIADVIAQLCVEGLTLDHPRLKRFIKLYAVLQRKWIEYLIDLYT